MSAARVLLVAHHCNPEWGSEPLIGWRWASHLDQAINIELITHVRNQPAIERAGVLRCKVHFVDTETLAARIDRWNTRIWRRSSPVNRLALEALAQLAFDRAACRIARRCIASGTVDVIHRVSPISPKFPTRLGTLGVPMLLGPINGGMTTMPGFGEIRRREGEAFLCVRPLARLLDPFRRTFASASKILVATEGTRRALPRVHRSRAITMSENAVELAAFTPSFARCGPQLRALYLGRLLPCKGVETALRALAQVGDTADVTLDIVGDGPDRARLEALTQTLQLEGRVVFHGAVHVTEVPARMQACDVYVFPSVRESGGSTVMEAMAAGKPVIVANHGGPAETVTGGTGFALDANGPDALVSALARTLHSLADDEELRSSMGRSARRHVEDRYTWNKKVASVLRYYDEVSSGSVSPGADSSRNGMIITHQ
ncbi:MAG: glycosyltransferase involved in cell wall biosynthesis [Planctomycetota bacterium]|jgi:glycosyltransferase involved in cell wall biosynthesis